MLVIRHLRGSSTRYEGTEEKLTCLTYAGLLFIRVSQGTFLVFNWFTGGLPPNLITSKGRMG